jgi:hypothetical protein
LQQGITAPITSKVLPSEVESSAVQPLERLSPLIKIISLQFWGAFVFIFHSCCFLNQTWKIKGFLILIGGYLVARNDSRLLVSVVVVVKQAVFSSGIGEFSPVAWSILLKITVKNTQTIRGVSMLCVCSGVPWSTVYLFL